MTQQLDKVGPYEVVREIGRGGMGVVYLARDTKLDRDVAIKALPEEFLGNEDRLTRFEREAKLLASLSHGNIASVYGLEEANDQRYLIMEYVEGEDLSQRLKRGAIPVDEAIEIAVHIAQALEAAHDKGVVHRDIKPANIKLTPDGDVKVLDFGLAKSAGEAPSTISELANSPTVVGGSPTMPGVILGTAGYLSPEQARGRPVDKRTDIFSFGCVLYEMLTGSPPFPGETATDSIGATLHAQVNFERVPPNTPRIVRHVLARCLERDRKNRLRDIADARLELEQPPSDDGIHATEAALQGSRSGWLVAGLLAIVAAALGVVIMMPRQTPVAAPIRLDMMLGAAGQLAYVSDSMHAISPDGSTLVFVAKEDEESGQGRLYIRRLGEYDATPLARTEGAKYPTFSPEGQWVCYFAEGSLRKIAISGGAPITLCEANGTPRGVSWGDAGLIAFAGTTIGIWLVPENGGEVSQLLAPRTETDERSVRWPHFLPGSEALLFTSQIRGTDFDDATIEALTLADGQRTIIHVGGSNPRYTTSGHLVFGRAGTLFACAFDPVALRMLSSPAPALDGVRTIPTSGEVSCAISETGTLVFRRGNGERPVAMLEWVDLGGERTQVGLEDVFANGAVLSPDGTRIALQIYSDATEYDIWIAQIERGTLSRLTSGPGNETAPIWSPDGRYIAYSSDIDQRTVLFMQLADGSGDPVQITLSGTADIATNWSPDGTHIAFMREIDLIERLRLWSVEIGPDGATSEPEKFITSEFEHRYGAFSPDGERLAYTSIETGQPEVYIRSYPDGGERIRVSTRGGTMPVWSHDGTELFYWWDNFVYTCSISKTDEGELRVGRPKTLFEHDRADSFFYPCFSVTRDGQRFLTLSWVREQTDGETPTTPLILNWFTELEELTEGPRSR